jgi:hypothetical protein
MFTITKKKRVWLFFSAVWRNPILAKMLERTSPTLERTHTYQRKEPGVQIELYSPIARVDRSNVVVQVRVSNPQRIVFVKNQLLNA